MAMKSTVVEKQSEQSQTGLTDSAELAQALIRCAATGIYIVMHGRFIYVNSLFEELTGYAQDELLSTYSLNLVHPEDRELVRRKAIESLKTPQSSPPFEYRFIRKNGDLMWVLERVTSTKYRGKRATVGSFVDITQRKQAEAQFKAQKELIDRILANMPSGVLVVGRDLQIVLANKAFYDTFKMKMGDAEGRRVKDVIPMSDLSKVISIALTDRKAQLGLEFRYKVATVERILVAHAIPMGEQEVLLFLHDVTDDRQRQERLYFTDRLASIGEMTSGIAHELNNPLTSVIAFSQLLMDGDFSDDAKEDLACIHSEAQRAAEIVKNLLTFARKHEPVRQLTQINKLVEDMLKLRAYELRVNNIQVNTHFTPELPEIMVDYFQMQQVFLNIILNAETAMIQAHNQGTLTIKTERVDSIIRISLTDDGPGIAEENLSRIFDPFFTTKEVGSGTGLGLSICYGIVAGHRGNIYARSQPDKGTTFVLELPITATS